MRNKQLTLWTALVLVIIFAPSGAVASPLPGIDLSIRPTDQPADVVDTVKLLLILTVLALVPAFLMLLTSFTRIVVVLSFLRQGLGTQQTPPNQVLVGLALFLTLFIMRPVFADINTQAVQPYLNNEINQEEATDLATEPLREFMSKQTREKDLALFINIADLDNPENIDEVPMTILVPAFIISELKTAFLIGFLIFVPFLVIDMVVASTLMSMGMFMLPPIMISLPFKVLLFVMVDGWYLVVKSLVESFR